MDADSDVALDILITNVVCVFRTRCHLNLRKIALEGANVIYKRDVGKVLMKLRKPRITATIWSSGKIICTGATSEEEAKFGARRLARSLQKLGFQVIFTDFKVVNVLAVCNMPFEIRLPEFTKNNRPHASYEPELHPAVCYRIKSLRATLQIFSTGSITVTELGSRLVVLYWVPQHSCERQRQPNQSQTTATQRIVPKMSAPVFHSFL
ncbi:TATA box-binding protein-like 1 isoform X1 [Prionailurus bengalensis]|uniref:TATA box-binding protein-like 1 isoform X1 n=1 Tax=Prionailurus bengalensis TaxID=37029 RepID=UPI001CA7FA12|nr:TATA box-binding protein-like 1 isoform X1 [Prionailurus bengalensis]XP_043448354.1 TATA box-binding protein-like 1 isoform X1 [Prionailurus bengalensis]XP_043448355.1 TATA box-binding protein-like 1 isoform X1 [Prionailurus bengalensis]XP_043448356.1 TATA box-binding protein-like 1 isoform X1 [Prionailurus bengalensis]XP_043448358.1 TATA box-binding protein-like 1 isoform X1 [Prionailurus bengalensis]XP_043448359.1 TATA box-binding protein-like 1 isoform X1 [Prionailurus bengalensis]XP_04